eukprot:2211973-Alexandrium_andersonii.AAC.1
MQGGKQLARGSRGRHHRYPPWPAVSRAAAAIQGHAWKYSGGVTAARPPRQSPRAGFPARGGGVTGVLLLWPIRREDAIFWVGRSTGGT